MNSENSSLGRNTILIKQRKCAIILSTSNLMTVPTAIKFSFRRLLNEGALIGSLCVLTQSFVYLYEKSQTMLFFKGTNEKESWHLSLGQVFFPLFDRSICKVQVLSSSTAINILNIYTIYNIHGIYTIYIYYI